MGFLADLRARRPTSRRRSSRSLRGHQARRRIPQRRAAPSCEQGRPLELVCVEQRVPQSGPDAVRRDVSDAPARQRAVGDADSGAHAVRMNAPHNHGDSIESNTLLVELALDGLRRAGRRTTALAAHSLTRAATKLGRTQSSEQPVSACARPCMPVCSLARASRHRAGRGCCHRVSSQLECLHLCVHKRASAYLREPRGHPSAHLAAAAHARVTPRPQARE